LQNLIATDNLAIDENIYMRSHFTHLVQYAIAQAGVLTPQTIQCLANRRIATIQADLDATAREFG
jgi:hypothetical protein